MKTPTLALLLAIALPLRADPLIEGTIGFSGTATTDSGDLFHAGAFTSISAITEPGDRGDYAGVTPGAPVDFPAFAFSAPSVEPLWTFDLGGVTYSFDATSIDLVGRYDHGELSFVELEGDGIASITGFAPTPGDWGIEVRDVDGDSSFTFGATSSVPDATPTAILLAIATVAIAASGRRALR
jgi:hypothetical protein